MKVIRNSVLPVGRRHGAINMFGVVFARHSMTLTPEIMNHEAIHTAQMRELLYVPFYIIYVVEWLVRVIIMRGDTFGAYKALSFEREAYARGADPRYLFQRCHYAMWRRDDSHPHSFDSEQSEK